MTGRDVPAGHHRVVATAGHVDHGKSTLLHALTGARPERHAEERRRGMTIDLGFVSAVLDDVEVAFVDVPGHERFVATMLAGVGAGPGALLVVAADGGWSAQSSEHRDILDLLGARAVALVITKADLADGPRLAEVRERLAAEVRGTSLEGAPVVVTDAVSGRGMDELAATVARRVAELPEVRDVGRPRLWIDRVFSVAGAGTVVTGTLVDGALTAGSSARLVGQDGSAASGGSEVRVRGLQMLGRDVPLAPPGSRVAVNLGGVHHGDVARGDVLTGGPAGAPPWRPSLEADVELRLLPGRSLGRRGAWRLHVGSASTGCTVRLPYGAPVPGGTVTVRVVLDAPLLLAHGDRVVLRDLGRRTTVGGGRVLDPSPSPLPRGAPARAARASLLARLAGAGSAGEVVRDLVALEGGMRDAAATLTAAGVVGPAGAPAHAGVRRVGDMLVDTVLDERLRRTVASLGAGVHDRAAVEALLARGGAPSGSASAWVDALVAGGALVRVRHGVSLPEHGASATDEVADRRERALAVIEAGGVEPPPFTHVAEQLGLGHLERTALLGSDAVVRAGPHVFGARAFAAATDRLRELEAATGPFTAAEARTHLGTSRRFAVPLLEALQARGLTRFDGQVHRFVR